VKAFIAAPFRGKINPITNEVDESYKEFITDLIKWLEKKGVSVFSAHRREEWGRKKYSNENIVCTDYDALQHCDVFIAYVDNTKSIGVPIEIGWASAMDKKIIIISTNNCEVPFFMKGLSAICHDFYLLQFSNRDNLLEKLDGSISSAYLRNRKKIENSEFS
jgi:nucleoside 2-deoxyribosyltransferase